MANKFKLTLDDEENLVNLAAHESYSSFIKIMNRIVEIEQSKVLNFNLNEKSFAQLAIAKARADGSAHLLYRFQDEIKRLVALTTGGNNGRK